MRSTGFALFASLIVWGGCSSTPAGQATVGLDEDAAVPTDAYVATEDASRQDASRETPDGSASDAATDAAGPVDATPVAPDAAEACPTFAAAVRTGFVAHLSVQEASGVVNSRRNPEVLWVHNDSGGQAQIFALTRAGGALATYTVERATAVDWEDIAIGPGPQRGEPYLYIADIGDNGLSRSSIAVYRALEPNAPSAPSLLPPTLALTGAEKFVLRYPDGAHNAETLLVDPVTGDLFIVEKASNGDSQIFRAAAPLSATATITLESVGRLRFGTGALPGNVTTTGGDISASGRAIAIRTYDHAFLWRRAPGESVARALLGEPCALPLASEGQGEALGFASDEQGYFTLSEGRAVPISFYARR
jgi:hypothetical protein